MRYIGCKKNLIDEIDQILVNHGVQEGSTFLDLFGGTNVVSNHFKTKYKMVTNDILYFSYLHAKATIENNTAFSFEKLRQNGISDPVAYLQSNAEQYLSKNKVGYYENSYSPTGGAMYLTVENAKRIDYMRDKIDEWYKNSLINEYEYAYLVSMLVDAIPSVSNTTGTYGAFLKHWDRRSSKPLTLEPQCIIDNNQINQSYNEDANQLVKKICVDVAYLDPPYNTRQYASNYHLLENVARNKKPDLRGKTRIFDWKYLKSSYSQVQNAKTALEDLIKNIDASHILLSYNSEGIIPEEEIANLLKKYSYNDKVEITKIPYRKYRSKRPTASNDLYEIVFYIQKKPIKKERKETTISNKVWLYPQNRYIKSPLNYIGGKYRILDQIIPLFPTEIDTFIDLFSGGANVGINASAKRYVFNDMNSKINEMFRFFATQDSNLLINDIEQRIEEHSLSKTNQEAYIEFRKQYNRNPNPLDLYILSSFSYNYQIRFNNSMQYNNPFGKNRSCFSSRMKTNLINFIERLHNIDAEFIDGYFQDFNFMEVTSNDFVYMDPPYLITTGSYNDGNRGFHDWGEREEKALYNIIEELNSRNIRFALSNVLTNKGKSNELLKEFLSNNDFNVHHISINYDCSSHNSNNTGSDEVLITNYQ